jgi:hypothetical protein
MATGDGDWNFQVLYSQTVYTLTLRTRLLYYDTYLCLVLSLYLHVNLFFTIGPKNRGWGEMPLRTAECTGNTQEQQLLQQQLQFQPQQQRQQEQ